MTLNFSFKEILYIFLVLQLCSCSAHNGLSTSSDNQISDTQIGLQAWSFRYYFPKDIPGTLDRVRDLGIKYLEMGIGSGKLPPEEYRKLCDARGITIPSYGTSFEKLENNLEEVINSAKALGATYIMCAAIPHKGGNFNLQVANNAINVFNKAGEALKKEGLVFCYHPHGYEFVRYKNSNLLEHIIESTNPKYVSFEMDIHWIYKGGGDPIQLLKKYGTRWKLMHLRDMKNGKSVVLGTGTFEVAKILKEAKKIGIKYYFIEDLNNKDIIEQLPKSIKYVKNQQFLSNEWTKLLDKNLSLWEPFIGAPTMKVEGIPDSLKSAYFSVGKPLGLNNDIKNVFSIKKGIGKKKLKVTGEIFGALTSKSQYENYHLQLQFKWGEKIWMRGPNKDTGILYHCYGEHGFLWNVYMRGIECQMESKRIGDIYLLDSINASIQAMDTSLMEKKEFLFKPKGKEYQLGRSYEKTIVAYASYKKVEPTKWNTIDLYCLGDSVIYVFNNQVVNSLTNIHTINTKNKNKIPLTRGQLQLQSAGAEVFFKNIRIKQITQFPEEIRQAVGFQ